MYSNVHILNVQCEPLIQSIVHAIFPLCCFCKKANGAEEEEKKIPHFENLTLKSFISTHFLFLFLFICSFSLIQFCELLCVELVNSI